MVTTSPASLEAHWFIGMGPHGPFTTSATQTTIDNWIADGYAHAGHDHMLIPHRADACEWRPESYSS